MRYLLFALILLAQTTGHAQPHIQGTVNLTMKDDLLDCDFTVTNLPPLTSYRLLLNHGMNIQFVISDSGKVLSYDGFYSGKMTGEALEYTLLKNEEDTFATLPASFRIKYRGAFPVYGDTLNSFDFKGLIAFNGKTARATEQSKWYPVLYDVQNDRLIDNYTYDIMVNSADCKTVVINGSVPTQKLPAQLRSNTPRALFLFAGDYDVVASNGNYILNADVDSKTAAKIFTELDRIKAFQGAALSLTYNENIYLISHKPVKPYPPQASWGFTIFPSFAYANLNFKTLLDSTGKMNGENIAFFAHELAHYYFGDNMLSGMQQWFWLESTAEYLSLKTSEALTDTAFYNKRLRRYMNFLKTQKYKPLASLKGKEEIDENYRYVYGPLLLLSFEKTFGQKTTFKVLSDLVKRSKTETATLTLFKKLALQNKIKETDYDRFYNRFFASETALANTVQFVLPAKP
ncbi:MAG TPA: hypothetical protein VM010_08315 [Chitinophagaceae bacterium]|nr:hypothetical protein [Chitinophagaceae bacterium]